ncbi:MAG: hypothetical protein ACFCUX_01670 [Candidatus Methylacidiphilales bacterium]
MKTKSLLLTLLFCGAGVLAAMEVGKTYFSKQASTPLLSASNRSAAPVGSVEWGKPLKVIAVDGRWLQVASGNLKGWVYSGNVTSEKPPAENKNDFLPTTAADTSAAVAARPLSESSKDYANRKSMGEAAADIEWAERQADAVIKAQVDAYMRGKALGEYGK